jgi:hypothetical protein
MVYGIVCFATLFSLIGTVLGGIWADQSWGRFWGWDPKENGALMIVLWNAVILHARWGGLVKQRGLMCLAIFRQHYHELELVRHQHARRRPAQLRFHGRRLLLAARVCPKPGRHHRPRPAPAREVAELPVAALVLGDHKMIRGLRGHLRQVRDA